MEHRTVHSGVAALAVLLFLALSAAAPLAQGARDTEGSAELSGSGPWALREIGWSPEERGVPVLVALVDSGIDWLHPDLEAARIWRNPREPLNQIDDDGNGYVDDRIGWDFVDADAEPWDEVGHGTHLAGLIAATPDNGIGITGVSRNAVLLPLEVLGASGRGRAFHVAAALDYATAQGARVINLSLGGSGLTAAERKAIRRATEAGAVVVLAAGNRNRSAELTEVVALPGVIVVAATGRHGTRAPFSNLGPEIEIAAPGVDLLSLRARGTDLLRLSGNAAPAGTAVVGSDRAYLRASGTSFSAALVSGVAARILSQRPQLTPAQVERVLLQSARDMAPEGVDQLTGYGLVDLAGALAADPQHYVEAQLLRVELAPGRQVLRVIGTARADAFAGARLRLVPIAGDQEQGEGGPKPIDIAIGSEVSHAVLTRIDRGALADASAWKLILEVKHRDGSHRRAGLVFETQGGPETARRAPKPWPGSSPLAPGRMRTPLSMAGALALSLAGARPQLGTLAGKPFTLIRPLRVESHPRRLVELSALERPAAWARSQGLTERDVVRLDDGSGLASVPWDEQSHCPAGARCSDDPCRTYLQDASAAGDLPLRAPAAALRGSLSGASGAPVAGATLRMLASAPRLGPLLGDPAAKLPEGAVAPGRLECQAPGYDAAFPEATRTDVRGAFTLAGSGSGADDSGCVEIVADSSCHPERVPLSVLAPELEPGRIAALVPADAADAGAALASLAGLAFLDATPLPSIDQTLLRFALPLDAGAGAGATVAVALAALRADPRIDLAQQERRFRTTGLYTDPLGGLSYGPAQIGAERLHATVTGAGVRVAVIDSGVDAGHPELAGRVVASRDATGYGVSPDRHGTAVAGLIAAQPNNGTGAWGAAPGAEIVSVKACQPAGPNELDARCWSSTVARALDLALQEGVRVLNLSIAGPEDPLVERLVKAAIQNGAVVIAAAGNGGPNANPSYPAALDGVIAVTAVDAEEHLYVHATRGAFVDLAAPGVEVITPAPGERYPALSGTSFATAFVSGAAALLLELEPGADAAAIREALEAGSRDLGEPGPDPLYGRGRVDLCVAAARLRKGAAVCP